MDSRYSNLTYCKCLIPEVVNSFQIQKFNPLNIAYCWTVSWLSVPSKIFMWHTFSPPSRFGPARSMDLILEVLWGFQNEEHIRPLGSNTQYGSVVLWRFKHPSPITFSLRRPWTPVMEGIRIVWVTLYDRVIVRRGMYELMMDSF